MLRFFLCLIGFHGKTEFDYSATQEEIKVCRHCLRVIHQKKFKNKNKRIQKTKVKYS